MIGGPIRFLMGHRNGGTGVTGIASIAATLLLAAAGQATGTGWTLQLPEGGAPVLEYRITDSNLYRFTCDARTVTALQTGVTELLDLGTGNRIGDGPGAVMPAGSATMTLYAGQGEPVLTPASAVKNSGDGWDLTIRLPLGDPQLRRITRAKIMSLFTTGHTTAVMLEAGDQAKWRDFLKACAALPGQAR